MNVCACVVNSSHKHLYFTNHAIFDEFLCTFYDLQMEDVCYSF